MFGHNFSHLQEENPVHLKYVQFKENPDTHESHCTDQNSSTSNNHRTPDNQRSIFLKHKEEMNGLFVETWLIVSVHVWADVKIMWKGRKLNVGNRVLERKIIFEKQKLFENTFFSSNLTEIKICVWRMMKMKILKRETQLEATKSTQNSQTFT